MLVPLGQMRDPAKIITPTRVNDASGGETVTYVEGDTIFVALRALTTSEAVSFGQVNASITHVLFGHWGDLNAINSKQRIRLVESGAEFDVAGGPINSPKRDWTKLTLVSRENG